MPRLSLALVKIKKLMQEKDQSSIKKKRGAYTGNKSLLNKHLKEQAVIRCELKQKEQEIEELDQLINFIQTQLNLIKCQDSL